MYGHTYGHTCISPIIERKKINKIIVKGVVRSSRGEKKRWKEGRKINSFTVSLVTGTRMNKSMKIRK